LSTLLNCKPKTDEFLLAVNYNSVKNYEASEILSESYACWKKTQGTKVRDEILLLTAQAAGAIKFALVQTGLLSHGNDAETGTGEKSANLEFVL
jgi:hypothetical protein